MRSTAEIEAGAELLEIARLDFRAAVKELAESEFAMGETAITSPDLTAIVIRQRAAHDHIFRVYEASLNVAIEAANAAAPAMGINEASAFQMVENLIDSYDRWSDCQASAPVKARRYKHYEEQRDLIIAALTGQPTKHGDPTEAEPPLDAITGDADGTMGG